MSDQRALSQFLAFAAHDLKQPLNVLQMYLGILQRRAGNDKNGGELGEVVNTSLKSVQSTLSLLTQWARAEERCLKQQPQPTSLDQWKEMVERLKRVTRTATSTTPFSGSSATSSIDLQLLQQTLQEVINLLPQPIHVSASEDSQELELVTPLLVKVDLIDVNRDTAAESYNDALFELGIRAGSAIIEQIGGSLTCTHQRDDDCSRLLISVP